MRSPPFLLLIVIFLMLSLTGWGEKKDERITETITTSPKILNRAVLFNISLDIQKCYFRYVALQKQYHGNEYVKLYAAITALTAEKTASHQPLKEFHFNEKKLQDCWQAVSNPKLSLWQKKIITRQYRIPDYVEIGEKVFFNPFVFLPHRPVAIDKIKEAALLWDWFYTAIMLKDDELLQQVAPVFFQVLTQKYPGNLQTFKNLYRMSQGKNSPQGYDTSSIAHFYLLTGIAVFLPPLQEKEFKKLLAIKKHYDSNYFKQEGVIVNRFTLDNRFFMWMAAREAEKAGDIDRAYVYLKTTFENSILLDVKDFHPNHLVYLYATVRLALKIHAPTIYSYVLGALDPLTKFHPGKNKKLLKTQLLQLMD